MKRQPGRRRNVLGIGIGLVAGGARAQAKVEETDEVAIGVGSKPGALGPGTHSPQSRLCPRPLHHPLPRWTCLAW